MNIHLFTCTSDNEIFSVQEKSSYTKSSNIAGLIKCKSMHMHVYCIIYKALKKIIINMLHYCLYCRQGIFTPSLFPLKMSSVNSH